jgi:hypothetical protein
MNKTGKVWLVFNRASGSNDHAAIEALERAFAEAGFPLDRKLCFPDVKPDRAMLESEGVELVAVFAGDGSVHWVVTHAYGWDGAVLVLPGGTMNMLAKRLHGDVPPEEIVGRLSSPGTRRIRPPVVRSPHGDGLSGALIGPGTAWNDVREAMREANVLEMAAATRDAIVSSTAEPGVRIRGMNATPDDGYAAITLTPRREGIAAAGYFASSLGEMAEQGLAMLRGDFRDGPHDDLGIHPALQVAAVDGRPMGLLIDGEPNDGDAEASFEIAACGVDLVATTGDEPDMKDIANAR